MIDLISTPLIFFAVALLLPYTLGPVLVYLTVSMPARYDFKKISSDVFLAERSSAFMELHNQLLDLGFDPVGGSIVETSRSTTRFLLYRHYKMLMTASLLTSEAPNISEVIAIDYTQRYSDEFCLTVNNMKDASVFPENERKRTYRYPGETDPAKLYVKFYTIIQGLGRDDMVELPTGREFEYISNVVENDMRDLVSSGIARPPARDGRLRLTFRGACVGTWKMLWPWKGILRRKYLRLAEMASKNY